METSIDLIVSSVSSRFGLDSQHARTPYTHTHTHTYNCQVYSKTVAQCGDLVTVKILKALKLPAKSVENFMATSVKHFFRRGDAVIFDLNSAMEALLKAFPDVHISQVSASVDSCDRFISKCKYTSHACTCCSISGRYRAFMLRRMFVSCFMYIYLPFYP